MAKPGEYTFFQNIGEDGINHSINKPFSDTDTASMFMDIGLFFSLLPNLPGKILECGCGTGWLSYFMAKKGYDVIGQDCNEFAIDLAKKNPVFIRPAGSVNFVCSDFEKMDYHNEFDAVVFYASLHHSEEEKKTITCAYNALKENGVLIALEPGVGQEKRSKEIMEKYDVGDRDMPPYLMAKRGKKAGFRKIKTYIHPSQMLATVYHRIPKNRIVSFALSLPGFKLILFLFTFLFYKRYSGVIWMQK